MQPSRQESIPGGCGHRLRHHAADRIEPRPIGRIRVAARSKNYLARVVLETSFSEIGRSCRGSERGIGTEQARVGAWAPRPVCPVLPSTRYQITIGDLIGGIRASSYRPSHRAPTGNGERGCAGLLPPIETIRTRPVCPWSPCRARRGIVGPAPSARRRGGQGSAG